MTDIVDPVVLAGAVAAVVLLLVVRGRLSGSSDGPAQDWKTEGIASLVAAGDYAQAGRKALSAGQHREAMDLFMRAEQPARAAQAAERAGMHRKAAELYEWAGDKQRAAACYRLADMPAKAAELDPAAPAPTPGTSPGIGGPEVAFRSGGTEPAPEPKPEPAPAAEPPPAAASGGAEEAERLMAEGDLAGAADAFAKAGLVDEAVQLYVNVLGQPGRAAELLASAGNHRRAAELYETAGLRERAAASLGQAAVAEAAPDDLLDRIVRLSAQYAIDFLRREIDQRPLESDTAPWHYHLGRAYEQEGDVASATRVFRTILQALGSYRDVAERVTLLASASAAPSAAASAGAAPVPDPAGLPPSALNLDALPEVPGLPSPSPLSKEQLATLAQEVAVAAAAELKKATLGGIQAMLAQPALPPRRATANPAPAVVIPGIELQPVELDAVQDSAVAAARFGPSANTLRNMIGSQPCELQNIEVYYRLGLAHLAQGEWDKARDAFDAVEEASPGYRDAWKRSAAIGDWARAMGERRTRLGAPEPQSEGRYSIQGELGRGGIAVVYRATDTVLGREVALKFLSEQFSRDKAMGEMFEREARAVAGLNHANIVTVYDFGVLEGRAFIAMELVDGRSVEDLLDEQSLTIVDGLRIIVGALEGLAFAHGRKVIHRDLKPANLMRTDTGVVKLMDFGLAKSLDSGPKSSIVAGTPPYMPPEQISGGDIDHRADLFALGVTLYELLTGNLPFEGLDRSPPVPVRELSPAVPEPVQQAIDRAIALDPEARWQSAAEFAGPLLSVLEQVESYGFDSDAPVPASPMAGTRDQPKDSKATVNITRR